MLIETMRLIDDECEGYAIRIDGETEFEYFTHYDALEDANLTRGHNDVLFLGEIIKDAHHAGSLSDGTGRDILEQRETRDREEYFEFVLGGYKWD